MEPFSQSHDDNTHDDNTMDDIEAPQAQLHTTDEILTSLESLLDNINNNKSMLSKLAEEWGKLSLWIKVGAAVLVFGPLLFIGVLALNTLLIVITALCTLLYTVISISLDNHDASTTREHQQFKSQLMSLGVLLQSTIQSLQHTASTLSAEVDRLSHLLDETTLDFQAIISTLHDQVETVKQQNEVLGRMIKAFATQVTQHDASSQALSDSLDQHLHQMISGNSGIAETMSKIIQLEKTLEGNVQRQAELLERYEVLVKEHEENHIMRNQHPCSQGVQTEPVLYANRLLTGIISTSDNEALVLPLSSSDSPLLFVS